MTERTQKLFAELQRVLSDKVARGTTYEEYLLTVAEAVRLNPELREVISTKGCTIIDSLLKAQGKPTLFDVDGTIAAYGKHLEPVYDAFDRRPTPAQVVADLLREMFPPKEG